MKKAFLLALVITSLFAESIRPKIALVLSGGGARGGAHVGVLKVLEENNIPIDIIVGTSMGSFVGGMYVSGMSPDEISRMLTTTEWTDYIRADYNRQDIPMRKKNIDYIYQGRLGIGVNTNNDLVLPTGVLKRQPMLLKFMELTENVRNIDDFDKLDIPYRAIATNIKNGNSVVLKSGSLAKAIYASSSIPGGFEPININGVDLVDGGVSDNMPIQVARDMGADIIIAVDVSENFDKELDVNSYFVVMGQLVNILMRKNANDSIKTLKEEDILLTPDLDGFTGLDADKYAQIIQRGVEVAEKNLTRLKKLSLSDKEYKEYCLKHRKIYEQNEVIIDEIEIINSTYLSNDSIRRRIHQNVDEPLDLDILRADLLHIYNMMIFDSVDYELKKVDGKEHLIIKTTPSWDINGEVRFAFGFEDDFEGHSSYSMKLGYTMYGLNSYGGEWKNDFEIGRYEKAYSEFFQPFDTMQRYYLRPSLLYESVTDIFPLKDYGNQELLSSRVGGSFVLGTHLSTNYEFEVGVSLFRDRVEFLEDINAKYLAVPIYAQINIDNLDNVNFPKIGMKAKLKWVKEMKDWGSDYNYEQVYLEVEKPFSFYSNNITLFMKYGNTYQNDNVDRLSGLFLLGGLFNLSGYDPYSFLGDNVIFGILKYTYEIKDGGFFGTLNAPLYAGFSLESGDAWSNPVEMDLKYSGTVYVAADTFMGPLYLAVGGSSEGEKSVYLYLGEKF
jgi:NTE family protein